MATSPRTLLKLAQLSLGGQLLFFLMKSLSQLQASPACLYRGLSACPTQIKVCHFVSSGVGEQELHNSSTEREISSFTLAGETCLWEGQREDQDCSHLFPGARLGMPPCGKVITASLSWDWLLSKEHWDLVLVDDENLSVESQPCWVAGLWDG